MLASEASAWGVVEGYSYIDAFGNTVNVDSYLPTNWNAAINCAKASAGLGALEWVLFIITLVMFGILPMFLFRCITRLTIFETGLSVHKYRLANNMGTAAATPGAPVMEEHKMEPVPVQQQWQQEPVPVQQQMPVQQQIYHQQQMA